MASTAATTDTTTPLPETKHHVYCTDQEAIIGSPLCSPLRSPLVCATPTKQSSHGAPPVRRLSYGEVSDAFQRGLISNTELGGSMHDM